MPPRITRQVPPRPAPNHATPPRRIQSEENVLDRIEDLGFDEDDGLNFLFYGESRTGKTTLWSSFPKPILAIICSGGQKPGELRSIDTPEMKKVVRTVTLRLPSEVDELCRAYTTGNLTHPVSGKPYATIILDHVSGFQDLKLAAYKGWRDPTTGKLLIRQQKGFGDASQVDWNEINAQCKEHLVQLLSLRCNVVIIAQERIFLPFSDNEKPEKKSVISEIASLSDIIKPRVGAALTPSLTGWLQPAVDYGAQTFIRPRMIDVATETKTSKGVVTTYAKQRGEGYEYCARVGVHDIFYTKFRTTAALVGFDEEGGMPEAIVLGDSVKGVYRNPSGYEKILALINKGKL